MPRPALVMLGNTRTATAWLASCCVPGWTLLRPSSAARAWATSALRSGAPETEAVAGPLVLELLPMLPQAARPTPAPSPTSTSERREIEVIILPPPEELRGQRLAFEQLRL